MYPTSLVRAIAIVASLALLAAACGQPAQTAPTAAPAPPTQAPKPAAQASPAVASSPAASPAAATKPSEPAKPAAPADTTPVTLTLWHGMQNVQEATLKSLLDDYKKIRPNVSINLDYTSYSAGALGQKVMAAIAANTTPDIVQGFPNDTSAWFDAGAVIPLDDYLKGSNGLSQQDLDDFFPSLLREGKFPQYQDKQLAFPFNKSLDGVMVYNATMLKAAGYDRFPAAWPDVEQMCAKVARPDVQCYVIQPSQSRTFIQVFAHGGEVLAPDLKSLHPSFAPAIEKWYERERSLIEKKHAGVVRDFSWQNEFGAGKVVFSATTSAGDPFIRDIVKGSFEYAFAPMPGADKPGGFSLSGTNLVIFKSNAQKQQAAWDFIKWVTLKEQSLKWATSTGYLPLRESTANEPAYKDFLSKNPRFNVLMEGLAAARTEPSMAAWSEIRTLMSDAENKVVSLSATPKAAAEELAGKANVALKR